MDCIRTLFEAGFSKAEVRDLLLGGIKAHIDGFLDQRAGVDFNFSEFKELLKRRLKCDLDKASPGTNGQWIPFCIGGCLELSISNDEGGSSQMIQWESPTGEPTYYWGLYGMSSSKVVDAIQYAAENYLRFSDLLWEVDRFELS